MDQDDLVDNIVRKYREDPRNKVIIDCGDLLDFASEELGISINSGVLLNAVEAYNASTADGPTQEIVDAATALCHQVADRCWGNCLDEEEDEWEEIDISVEWVTNADSEGSEVAAVVRKM